jgi:hypothetical protein
MFLKSLQVLQAQPKRMFYQEKTQDIDYEEMETPTIPTILIALLNPKESRKELLTNQPQPAPWKFIPLIGIISHK